MSTSAETTRILKADAARGLGSKVVFNFEDVRQQCDDYVQEIRRQTRTMLELAALEAEQVRKRAHEEGRQEGQREGMCLAEEEIQQRIDRTAEQLSRDQLETTLPAMISAADALAQERYRWLAEWESSAVELSVAIAEKIVGRQLELHPEIAKDMLREALELAAGSPTVKLRMHPHDTQMLGSHADEVVKAMASCAEASIVPDETMTRGGCVVETQHGTVDARIESQLQRLTEELLQREGASDDLMQDP
jgi:flagellar assembly protein FliH